MAEWSVEPLDATHDRETFSSGEASLDQFLQTLATQYEKRHLGRTYVATRPGEKKVLGYYTLASSSILFSELPPKSAKKLPKHPIPAILLGRLAVDQSTQGQGLGKFLLKDALMRSLELSQKVGTHAVVVDALNQTAKAFYEQFGFASLQSDEMRLYLPMATLEKGVS